MTDEERQTLLQSIAEGIETLLRRAAEEKAGARNATDSRRESGVDFFDAASQFHRRDVKEGQRAYEEMSPETRSWEETLKFYRRNIRAQSAHDNSGESEDWFAAHREAGHKMRDKKH